MAKWTVSQYSALPIDAKGNPMMIATPSRATVGLAAPGTVARSAGALFFRICGDTAFHTNIGGGVATTNDEYSAAGVDYWGAFSDALSVTFIAG